MTTMLFEPHEFKRLRAEIDSFIHKIEGKIMQSMDLESLQELDFVKQCYMESMRRDAPANAVNTSTMTRDVNIKGIDLRAGEAFFVGIQYVANDPEQWKEPDLFKPDRFDSTSDWYKKPDGGKRSPLAFVPFLGGSRVCLGKNFAETTLKIITPLWYHFFDFELVNEEQRKSRPNIRIGSTKHLEVPMKLTTRNKVIL